MEIKKTLRKIAFKSRIWLIKSWARTKENLIFIGRKASKAAKRVAFFTKKTSLCLSKGLALILDDLLLVAGITCITRGVFLIYVPAGYIMLGLCLFGMAYLIAYRKATVRR